MLNYLIGPFDIPGAFVVAVFFVCCAIGTTTWMTVHKTQVQRDQDFAITKMKLENEDRSNERQHKRQYDETMGQIASKREIEFKRIDSGMIDLKRADARDSEHG